MAQVTMEAAWLSDNLPEAIKADSNFMDKCPHIATDIQEKNVKLVTLVERLGSVLTDSDPQIRSRGTEVLAQVLQNLPNDFLLETELKFISSFFVDRLMDHHSVIPSVLNGLLVIAQMTNVPTDFGVRTLKNMFQHIQCQTLKPDDRRCIFKIVEHFIHMYTEDLQALGPDFVYGFMNMIDQEKDARNLLIIFGILPYFVKTFPLGHLAEEMFEIIACYFPVDYRSEQSSSAISREVLAEALQTCLVATADFAQFCIPLLLEKLDSKLKQAKLDSFKVLIAGCEVFPVESIRGSLLDLWRIIHHEILPGTDKEVREQGLAALKAIVRMMSVTAEDKQEAKALSSVTSFVLNAGISSLGEVELNLFLPAVRMMLTVAEATPSSCEEVSRKVIPALMKQYYREAGTEQKVIVLRALTSFVAECQKQKVTPSENANVGPLWVDIPSLYLSAAQLDETEIRKEGFHGLAVAAKLLNENNRSALYDLLNRSIQEEAHVLVRREVLLCFKEFSRIHTEEIMNNIVVSKLREIRCSKHAEEIFKNLNALCKIADEEPFTSAVVPCVIEIIETDSFTKCLVGMTCLWRLLRSASRESNIFRHVYYHCALVSRLVSWWLNGVIDDKYSIFENEEILINTARTLDMVMKNQSSGVQCDVVAEFVPRFIGVNPCMTEGPHFKLLDYRSSWKHTQMVVILEGLVGSLRQDVPLIECHKLIKCLTQLAVHSSHSATQLSACRLLATIVNKAPHDEKFSKLLIEIRSEGRAGIYGSNSSVDEKINAAFLFVWVVKALVMRGHPDLTIWIEDILELLADPIVGLKTAQGFSLIMDRKVEYLNSSNFCNVRILYKQRFFQITPKLVTAFHAANEINKSNYLVALAHLLEGVPKVVLLMDLDMMVPLLVESLEQKEQLLLLTMLNTLQSLVADSNRGLKHHLQTFIPRILNLTCFEGQMQIRIKALQCIYLFSQYPVELILPFKPQVLKVLGKCLDDHKRLVRKEAVHARSCWFVVGSAKTKLF